MINEKEDILDNARGAKTIFISDDLVKITWSDGAKITCILSPDTREKDSYLQKWAIDLSYKCGRKRVNSKPVYGLGRKVSDISFEDMLGYIRAVDTIASMMYECENFTPEEWA